MKNDVLQEAWMGYCKQYGLEFDYLLKGLACVELLHAGVSPEQIAAEHVDQRIERDVEAFRLFMDLYASLQ